MAGMLGILVTCDFSMSVSLFILTSVLTIVCFISSSASSVSCVVYIALGHTI